MRIAKRIGTVETEVQDLFNRDKQTNVRMDALAGPKEKVAPEVAKAKVEAAKAKVCRTPPLPILYDVDPRQQEERFACTQARRPTCAIIFFDIVNFIFISLF